MNMKYRKTNCQRLIRGLVAFLSIALSLAGAPGSLAKDQGKNLTKDQGKKKDPSKSPANPSELLKDKGKEPHRLAFGDVIEVRFFFNPELNDRVEIRPDGRISLQLISEVEVVGKTVEEVVKLLEKQYAEILTTPNISVQIRSYATQKIYVTGEVSRPGMISLTGGLTVLGAISEAGGIKHTGNEKSVILIRKGDDGAPMVYKLALVEEGKLSEQAAISLRPFDVIMAPESKITRMGRWVDQHIKQLNPVNLGVGFSYLYNHSSSLGGLPF
jgi:protein involved in polysaccharide export with SLBB domain